jgi:hypothetical protein
MLIIGAEMKVGGVESLTLSIRIAVFVFARHKATFHSRTRVC